MGDIRLLICATSSAIAAFSSQSEKKQRLRSLATMKRVATWTATSTFALSRARYGRAGTTAIRREPLGTLDAGKRHAEQRMQWSDHEDIRRPDVLLSRLSRLDEGL